jgi:small ligand-binding sensory domain FIST
MLAEIQNTLGTGAICGCSAWGVLGGGAEIEGEAGVAVLGVRSDRIRGLPHLEATGDDHGAAAARRIGERIAEGGGLLVTLPDPFAVHPELMLRGLREAAPGTVAVGGAAGGRPRGDSTFQFHGRNVATRSLAALHLSGGVRSAVGVTQGCQPLGPACRVTGCVENTVLGLDGQPALQRLRRLLPGGLADSIERLGGHLFVGLPPDPAQDRIAPGEYVVRPIVAVDPSRQALLLGQEVREGEPLLFVLRDPQAAREDLKRMIGRIASAAPEGAWCFGLYFNCAGRGASLYGLSGIDSAFLSRQFGSLPIVGFFGNAEIAPLGGASRLLTYTGVLALVGETVTS